MKKSAIIKLWHDPVWSKVIAAAILFAIAAIWSYFKGWWPSIGMTIARVLFWMSDRTLTPNWLLSLFSICTLLMIGLGAVILWAIIFPKPVGVNWRTFTTDEFFGIRWRWRFDSSGDIYDVNSFCSACDYQVYAHYVGPYKIVNRIAYRCEDCDRVLGKFEMSKKELEDRVIRSIQKKLRTGTWPKEERVNAK